MFERKRANRTLPLWPGNPSQTLVYEDRFRRSGEALAAHGDDDAEQGNRLAGDEPTAARQLPRTV